MVLCQIYVESYSANHHCSGRHLQIFLHCFSKKVRLDVSSESSARQRIHVKNQALFPSKDKKNKTKKQKKQLKCRLLQFLFGALRIKSVNHRDYYLVVMYNLVRRIDCFAFFSIAFPIVLLKYLGNATNYNPTKTQGVGRNEIERKQHVLYNSHNANSFYFARVWLLCRYPIASLH